MARTERNVGRGILAGLRELKRSNHGRITTVPDADSMRVKTGLSQVRVAGWLGVSVSRSEACRTRSRATGYRPVPRVRCCSSPTAIPRAARGGVDAPYARRRQPSTARPDTSSQAAGGTGIGVMPTSCSSSASLIGVMLRP